MTRKLNFLLIFGGIGILIFIVGVALVFRQGDDTGTNSKGSKSVNQASLLNNINSQQDTQTNTENQDVAKIPSDWKEFRGEKLGFTVFIPPTWVTTSHFETFNQPTDPVEPASYDIATRLVNEPILEWTDGDVSITIKKFRLHNRSFEEIIQSDSRIYNLNLIKTMTIDGQNAKLFLREIKEGVGTEFHNSYVMYIEDKDGLFSLNATYFNQEKFDELNRETTETIMESFKKS